jgi:isopentenyl phosphate kinase
MQRTILAVAALAAGAIAAPVTAAQGSAGSVAQDVVYGGVTGAVGELQGYPVVLELNKAGTKVVSADIVLDLACQVPPDATGYGDRYKNIKIAKGRFASTFGPERVAADPAKGTGALDVSGAIAGRVNKARTKITGTWSYKIVYYDPADPTGAAVKDTCDSGPVKFSAKN